jgi:hypothetical protein
LVVRLGPGCACRPLRSPHVTNTIDINRIHPAGISLLTRACIFHRRHGGQLAMDPMWQSLKSHSLHTVLRNLPVRQEDVVYMLCHSATARSKSIVYVPRWSAIVYILCHSATVRLKSIVYVMGRSAIVYLLCHRVKRIGSLQHDIPL